MARKLNTGEKIGIIAGITLVAIWGKRQYDKRRAQQTYGAAGGSAVMQGFQAVQNMLPGSSSGSGSGSSWTSDVMNYIQGASGSLPRGLKNNNPLNLILTDIAWQGKIPRAQNSDGKFEQFESILYGYRAAIKNLQSYMNSGSNTISKITQRWAPVGSGEGNNPENYARRVSQGTGIGTSAPLSWNPSQIIPIVREMAVVENGESFRSSIKDSDIIKAWSML